MFTGDRTKPNFFGDTMKRVMISKVNQTRDRRDPSIETFLHSGQRGVPFTVTGYFDVLKCFVGFGSLFVQGVSGCDIGVIVLD